MMKHGDVIRADGKDWKVLAVGATENGATCVHLASTTKGERQKNGFRPVQVCGWLRGEKLEDRP